MKKIFLFTIVVFKMLSVNPAYCTETKITASDGAVADLFGQSVSISSDYAIVGAYFDDDNGSYSGSSYIYYYNGSTWIEQQKLLASDGAYDDRFGKSVSISGDYAIAGAWYDDDNGSGSGSSYIFYRNEGGMDNWGQQQKLLGTARK